MNFKASVKETGQTRQISGLDTREVVLTMVMEGTDKESGQKGSMTVTSNMWLAKNVPGYEEVRAFSQKMAQKLAWMPGSNAFTQGRGDMAKAFGDLQKEGAKLDGVPVLQLVSMGAVGEGQPGQPTGQASQKSEQRESPSVGGALGRLGGLGGLGRRKKQEEPPPQEQQQQQTAATGAPGSLSGDDHRDDQLFERRDRSREAPGPGRLPPGRKRNGQGAEVGAGGCQR